MRPTLLPFAVAGALAAVSAARPAFAEPPPAPGIARIPLDIGTPFVSVVHPLEPWAVDSMVGVSWHPGCPVLISDLVAVDMTYWGFDDRPHVGRLVVNGDISAKVVRVFRKLYNARFPIRRMLPVDVYGGSDDRSMEADNTSAFNCRPITGGTGWSIHSYGRAIDINTVENPYVKGTLVLPATGGPYVDRSQSQPGMIEEGDVVTTAFDAEGFDWGGRWITLQDYQHFEYVP